MLEHGVAQGLFRGAMEIPIRLAHSRQGSKDAYQGKHSQQDTVRLARFGGGKGIRSYKYLHGG